MHILIDKPIYKYQYNHASRCKNMYRKFNAPFTHSYSSVQNNKYGVLINKIIK